MRVNLICLCLLSREHSVCHLFRDEWYGVIQVVSLWHLLTITACCPYDIDDSSEYCRYNDDLQDSRLDSAQVQMIN